MSAKACPSPIGIEDLTQYWLGELDDVRESIIEAHLFECASCSAALGELAGIAMGLRGLAQTGAVATVLTPSFLSRLKTDGAQVREYHLDPGGSVNCTIAPDDDLVVAHLRAPLTDVRRLDLVFDDGAGGPSHRMSDVAFNPMAGEIVYAPRAEDLRQLGTATQRVFLVAVNSSGERRLGEYLFCHGPHEARFARR